MPYRLASAKSKKLKTHLVWAYDRFPTSTDDLGECARKAEPVMEQIFIKRPETMKEP